MASALDTVATLPPAAKDRDAVGHGLHLVKLVRDDDHRMPFPRHHPQGVEQLVRLLRRQHRGRLVENEHARATEDGLDDLDALLLADGELPDARVGVHLHVERLGDLAHLPHARSPAQPQPRLVPAEHQVLRDGQRLDQPKVLVDHADAGCERVPRRVEPHGLAEQLDLSVVRAVEARQHVHQRGLARAVLAEERVHLSRGGLEVDVLVRDDAREALRDSPHRDGRYRRGAGSAGASRRIAARERLARLSHVPSPWRCRPRP